MDPKPVRSQKAPLLKFEAIFWRFKLKIYLNAILFSIQKQKGDQNEFEHIFDGRLREYKYCVDCAFVCIGYISWRTREAGSRNRWAFSARNWCEDYLNIFLRVYANNILINWINSFLWNRESKIYFKIITQKNNFRFENRHFLISSKFKNK